MAWLKRFRKWLRGRHRHRWVTTHVNRWCNPTGQRCTGCGLTRWKETSSINAPGPWLEWWRYSDGTRGPKSNVFAWLDSKNRTES